MLLEPSSDQEFLRDTTARFLANEATVDDLRARRDDPVGFDRSYWKRGAELGWISLLAAEEHGGGSVSGRGLVDLTLIAYEFGYRGAPGPLVASNVVAAALSAAPRADQAGVLEGIVAGTTLATWALEEGPAAARDAFATTIEPDGGEVVVTGLKRPVESAGAADYVLVSGCTGGGVSQVLVPAGSPGFSIRPLSSLDLTRRFDAVSFDGVRVPASAVVGELAGAGAAVAHQLQLAVAVTCAESVGAMQHGFDMTVDWAFDRYSFGRPLASYQALKHRFADMKSWLEASHAVADAAAAAVADGAPEAPELCSAAKAFIGQYGGELMQDCVQLHGGIGVTFEHDLHVFLRRLSLDRMLYGAPPEHRGRLGQMALGEMALTGTGR